MKTIKLTWTWTTESPLHVGSGLSRPGVADRLIRRDDRGNPLIPGDAVRGALRMSAEQLMAWLGRATSYGEGPTEPTRWPLTAVFGGGAASRFSPAIAVVPANGMEHASITVEATAIDARTGIALDSTLRTIEVLAPGTSFLASLEVQVPEADAASVRTFLLAALHATEAVAGREGIGWGRVRARNVKVNEVDALPCNAEELRKLFERIPQEPGQQGPPHALESKPVPRRGQPPDTWFQLDITLEEPACFLGSPEVTNTLETTRSIPAATLRGALSSLWTRKGRPRTEILDFLSELTRYSLGFPVRKGTDCVPLPRSLFTSKDAAPGSKDGLADLSGLSTSDQQKLREVRWRPARGQWMRPERPGTKVPVLDEEALGVETVMHVALEYLTGSKRVGALFTKESLLPRQKFRAWALLPKDAFDGTPATIHLGKRTSAGNGRATCSVTAVPEPGHWHGQGPRGRDVFVELLAPAIVRGAHGHSRRTIDIDDWRKIVEGAIQQTRGGYVKPVIEDLGSHPQEKSARATASGRHGSWMSTWGHPRAPTTTIQAGSAWRLRCTTETGAEQLHTILAGVGQIGERRHEGFGWIAVDPEWLGHPPKPSEWEDDPALPPIGLPPPRPWPDTDPADRQEIEQIAEEVLNIRLKDSAKGPLQQIRQMIRDGASFASVSQLIERQATERKLDRWQEIQDQVLPVLHDHPHPDLMLFALEAFLARVRGSRG